MPASYLKIGGELIKNAILYLVEVTQELNQHWWCRIECRQTEDIRIPVEDFLGKDLQILTWDQKGAEHIIFDGLVLESGLVYEIYGNYTAKITAVTRSYKLDLTAQEAYYRKKQLTDVANSLAGDDALQADVQCKSKPAKNYVQWGETDFRFLQRLAYEHRAWLRPTAQGIQICDSFQKGAKLTWRNEDGLSDFEVEGRLAQAAFNGTHQNARTMQSKTFSQVSEDAQFYGSSGPMVTAVKRESRSNLPAGFVHLDSRAATPDEYEEVLKRESVRAIGSGVIGHGWSRNEELQAGNTVEIEGILDANGRYGVTKVVHRWIPDGYSNEFWCTPWTNYVSPMPPEPPHIAGVIPARVVDHNDPRKMGRIQVQYDWQESGATGWARMATPHAGSDRGFMFMPEKGDEVLVAFEHGDPERPFVLGSLWNGVDTAPRDVFWGADVDPNDVKRIVTKSGHRIQLVDKAGKESIVVATPTHLKISLLEKADETGRSMILLHTDDGDVFFSAPDGRIHLRSKYLTREVGVADKIAQPSGPPTHAAAAGPSPSPSGPAPAGLAPPPPASKTKKKSWIEITLHDEDGQPVPGEKYRIHLPDGTTRDGTLDSKGYARVDGIDPGTCHVTFPDRDAKEWKRR